MKIEALVSNMMRMNNMGRLWHWTTDTASHHTAYETFLTENETLTDGLVESALGNDMSFSFSEVKIEAQENTYSLDNARNELRNYRGQLLEAKTSYEKADQLGTDELVTILDSVIELTSKTLYLLKLK